METCSWGQALCCGPTEVGMYKVSNDLGGMDSVSGNTATKHLVWPRC